MYCNIPIGGIFKTFSTQKPDEYFDGTTWLKLENFYFKGTTGTETAGTISGNNQLTLVNANMPPHGHIASGGAHTHVAPPHTHTVSNKYNGYIKWASGTNVMGFSNSLAGGGLTTGSATPTVTIGNTGDALPINIEPHHMKIHVYKRLT